MSNRRGGKRILGWDSCVFLAWIKDEPQPEQIKNGIKQMLERAYGNEAVIVTSAITLIECLKADLDPQQRKRYAEAFHHHSLQLVDVDRRVAEYAAVIRQHYDTRKFDRTGQVSSGSCMSLGDSIQLATALHVGAHEFHTLDGSGRRTRRIDLLALNGNVAGRKLAITKPYYIPPPEPLSGPLPSAQRGVQSNLFASADDPSSPTEQEPLSAAASPSGVAPCAEAPQQDIGTAGPSNPHRGETGDTIK